MPHLPRVTVTLVLMGLTVIKRCANQQAIRAPTEELAYPRSSQQQLPVLARLDIMETLAATPIVK